MWIVIVILVSFFASREGMLLLPLADWASYSLCALFTIPGMAIGSLGLKACRLGVIRLDTPVLITGGIYAYMRHPICLSCVLLTFGVAIGFKSGGGLIVAILASIVAYLHALLWEERRLGRQFGKEYYEYKQKVGMFIPKLSVICNNYKVTR